jgi:hypothetical protein
MTVLIYLTSRPLEATSVAISNYSFDLKALMMDVL